MTFVCPKCQATTEMEALPSDRRVRCVCGNVYSVDPSKPTGGRSLAVTVAIIVIAVMVLLCGGGAFLVLGTPLFLQPPRRQPECKSELKSIFTAQKALFIEKDYYSEDNREVGAAPEEFNRYAYFLGASGALEDRTVHPYVRPEGPYVGFTNDTRKHPGRIDFAQLPATVAGGVKVGVSGTCPDCQFVAVCVANHDGDPDLDIWSIASFNRTDSSGETIGTGQPFNDRSDI